MEKSILFGMILTFMVPLTAHAVPCFHDMATHYTGVHWIEQLSGDVAEHNGQAHKGDFIAASDAGTQGPWVVRGGGVGHAGRGAAQVDGRPGHWGNAFGEHRSFGPPSFNNGLPTLEIGYPWTGPLMQVIPPVSGNDPAVVGTLPVPEPATMLLFGTGLIGLAGIGRRKR